MSLWVLRGENVLRARTSDGKIWECDDCPCVCANEWPSALAINGTDNAPSDPIIHTGVLQNLVATCLTSTPNICLYGGLIPGSNSTGPTTRWMELRRLQLTPPPPVVITWRMLMYGSSPPPTCSFVAQADRVDLSPYGTYNVGVYTWVVS